jgi:hypothetical protein
MLIQKNVFSHGYEARVEVPALAMQFIMDDMALVENGVDPVLAYWFDKTYVKLSDMLKQKLQDEFLKLRSALDNKSSSIYPGSFVTNTLPFNSLGDDMPVNIKKKSEFSDHLGAGPTGTMVGKPVNATVNVQKKMAAESAPHVDQTTQEKVMDSALLPPHLLANVHVSGTTTINLGNYESAKITVGVTFPCHKDDITNAYEFASDWVSDKIAAATKDIKGG